jgi:hypothetical protein
MSDPMFPTSFTLETTDGDEVSIEMKADGTWSGDGKTFLEAAAQLESDGDAVENLIVWLLVRAIKADLKA